MFYEYKVRDVKFFFGVSYVIYESKCLRLIEN